MMISEGFKVSDFGGGPDHKSSVFPQFQVSEAGNFLHANMPKGTLQVAHGVIRFCSDFVFCPQKPPKNTKAIALVFWQKVK